MSEVEYLQANPDQFDWLVKFVKDKDTHPTSSSSQSIPCYYEPKNLPNNLITIPSSIPRKVEPFYISLVMNGFKLSNRVIDSGALDNVIPSKVGQCLRIKFNQIFGNCYSMENKQVPLVGKVKDAQFAFVYFPKKWIKMTILVSDVLASHRILLGHNFYKDVGGEINMDMSQSNILVKGVMKKLLPERETKHIV